NAFHGAALSMIVAHPCGSGDTRCASCSTEGGPRENPPATAVGARAGWCVAPPAGPLAAAARSTCGAGKRAHTGTLFIGEVGLVAPSCHPAVLDNAACLRAFDHHQCQV